MACQVSYFYIMAVKTKQIILIAIAILIIAVGGTGFYFYNKGPLDVRSGKGIRVNAAELYNIYSNDTLAAKKKYTGKIVEVTGEVNEISTNALQQKIVLLKTTAGGAHVNCTLEESTDNIQPSQKITLKGIASGIGQGDAELGILGDVYLTRCYVAN